MFVSEVKRFNVDSTSCYNETTVLCFRFVAADALCPFGDKSSAITMRCQLLVFSLAYTNFDNWLS